MKNKISTSVEEIETTWNFSKFHTGDWVEVFTSDKVMMHRYERFSKKHPDHCHLTREDKYSMTFTIDPKCMGVYPRAPRKAPALTEEMKEKNRERLENLRKAKDA